VIQEFLKDVSLFRELDEEELAQILMVGLVRRYPAGAIILGEGTAGGRLQIIHEGQVRISKVVPGVGEEALAILRPGDFFGEVEFLDGSPASAQAIAHSDCEILSVPHSEIENLMRSCPELSAKLLWALARTLAARLRDTNQKLAGLFAISQGF
jgi:CRP/FNR family cyclic AMP-dependent transcriptional regulator